jgi:hypothetical protein
VSNAASATADAQPINFLITVLLLFLVSVYCLFPAGERLRKQHSPVKRRKLPEGGRKCLPSGCKTAGRQAEGRSERRQIWFPCEADWILQFDGGRGLSNFLLANRAVFTDF